MSPLEETPGDLKREYASRSDQELDPTAALSELPPGTQVVDRNGDKIGEVVQIYRPVTVDEMGSMESIAYIRVGHRGLLHGEIYVPSDVVTDVGDGVVRLSVDKDMIPDMVWDRPYNIAEDDDPKR